jgi:hypothetical protein
MKSKVKLPSAGRHKAPKPRLRTRHLSSTGKSAYSGAGASIPAFPSAPGAAAFPAPAAGAVGAPSSPGMGGADSAPLAGPGGAPGM